MDENFTSILAPAKNILVILPVKPSFDAVAAGLSLYISLRESGREAEIYCPTLMNVSYNRLVGVNFIKSEIGNRNLSITFPNYEPTSIEKVSYDIDNGQFKLTVVPKTGFTAPQKEQINVSYSGVNSDLLILIGGSVKNDFPSLSSKELSGVQVVHLGTRVLDANTDKGILSLAKPASCISELVTNLIKDNGFEIHPDIATNLVMGMEEGSIHFESSEVTPETFEVFAYLLRNGGQRMPKSVPAGTFPPGAIPTQPFGQKVSQVANVSQVPQDEKLDAQDIEGTSEALEPNPPADWLSQPKVYQGTSIS